MIKNITLSASEGLIRQAREKAIEEGSSLNERFREWLKYYIGGNKRLDEYRMLMKKLSYTKAPDKKPTREEMNER
ncbi:MAG: hypothetical protein IIB82_01210 [Bacteroidetes bacterium]|nr:hypothetical protein [Bacteroidota bacterium]